MAFLILLFPLNLFALTIATYNVQNYFNNDPQKTLQINKVIKAMKYPEILGLQEVESAPTIKNYQVIMSQVEDKRGMGVALHYKIGKLVKKSELIVPGSRSILEVKLKIFENFVTFFVLHWPSKRNPKKMRVQAANILLKRIKDMKNEYFFILGDFNFDPLLEKNPLMDNREIVSRKIDNSYFYIPFRQWRSFDRILWSRNIRKVFEYKVFKPDFITTKILLGGRPDKIPWRYGEINVGFSDHFPVYLKYKI